MKVVLIWLLVSVNPHITNGFEDQTVYAAFSTKSACEAIAENYVDKEWKYEKQGRYGPKMPTWFPLEYMCTEMEVDPK